MANSLYEIYGINNSVLFTAALLSLHSILHSNDEIRQSHKMMTIHLILFNIYSVVWTEQNVVFYGYTYGWLDISYWAFTITVESFAFLGILSNSC